MPDFKVTQKILFQHCDTAGIVFYPRYFEMINAMIERWFEEELGYSFARMHVDMKTGIPTAHIDVDFKRPSRLGEEITIQIAPIKIGRSSINCLFKSFGNSNTEEGASEIRFMGEVTLVYFSTESGKPLSLPDDMRKDLNRFLQPIPQEQEK